MNHLYKLWPTPWQYGIRKFLVKSIFFMQGKPFEFLEMNKIYTGTFENVFLII